jgi:hypothetical protein
MTRVQDGARRGGEEVRQEVVGVPEGAAEVLEVLQRDPHAFELQRMGEWGRGVKG